MSELILSTSDYTIIVIMLAVSAAIGIYFRFFGQKQKTNEDYLFAGKNMSIGPVAFSLMATYMSTLSLMGIPSDTYVYGTNMVFLNVGYFLGPIISSFVFLPIYFDTGVSTSYEYLQKRFGKTTRKILSVLFLVQNVLFSGIVLYAPALALSAVTNLSIWTSVTSIGIICTCYCTLGGMKAVLWTDVFQALLMYACLLTVIINGCMELGGISGIFDAAYSGGRILMPTFNMDFSTRYTVYSVILHELIFSIYSFGTGQTQVQRQLTLKNLRRSITANLISVPMMSVFNLLCCLCGLVAYVHFKSCDPVTSPAKPIQSADQIIPYYIASSVRQYPGLPGLCIAGIFSASLSSISSAINAMAAVTYEDVIRPIWPKVSGSVLMIKIATIFYGALAIFLAYLASYVGNILKSGILVVGITCGPALGVFLLAALTTSANELGANLGVIAGFISGACMAFIPNKRHYPELPFGNNCSLPLNEQNYSLYNSTLYSTFNTSELHTDTSEIRNVSAAKSFPVDNFPVSHMWISPMSLLICLTVGYIGSCVTSYFRKTSNPVPASLLSPIRQSFLKDNVNHFESVNQNELEKGPVRCFTLTPRGSGKYTIRKLGKDQYLTGIQGDIMNKDELWPLQNSKL